MKLLEQVFENVTTYGGNFVSFYLTEHNKAVLL